MTQLTDKVVLVTGAAAGIGQACARHVAECGANILVADVDQARGESLAAELGPSALFCQTDVAREDQFAAAIERAVAAWGRLDGLVNNAGVVVPASPLEQTSNDQFDRLVDVNLKGTFFGCKLAHPHLKRSRGSVVNIASMAGVTGQADHAVYGATKGAIIALTRCAAIDWGLDGIRINAICPAAVRTEALERWSADQADPPKVMAALDGIHALNRCAEPREIATAAAFLLSDDSSFITGCILPVSGGSECGFRM